jgi:hypothetical protein
MFAERPTGLNPMRALSSWFNTVATGNQLQSEKSDTETNLTNLLLNMQKSSESATPTPGELFEAIKEGYTWDSEKGTWVSQGEGITQLKGQDAVKQVQKEGGSSLLNIAKTKTERESLAETILSFGSVNDYKAQANLEEVMNKDDYAKFKAGSDLLQDVNTLQAYFPRGTDTAMNIFGSGNLTGGITGRKIFLRNGKQVTVQALIADLATKKSKELSGVAISPQEMQRMIPMLPQVTDQENEVADKLDTLARRIEMNLAAKEAAARLGVDPASYWNKNKDALLIKYGFQNEASVGGQSNMGIDDAALDSAILSIRGE